MFLLPYAIIQCRDALEFARIVQFAREHIDSTFFQGCSTNDLVCRWFVETQGLNQKLCVRLDPESKQNKAGWDTESFYREMYPHVRRVNLEEYDTYACYADILIRRRLGFKNKIGQMSKEIEENEVENNTKYYAYLEELRQVGFINMFEAVPYLQKDFPELQNDRKQAESILLSWMEYTERSEAQ